MGNFRIVIDAAGGHGCDRVAKVGEVLSGLLGCTAESCPDHQAAEFVKQLVARGAIVETASLTHWPGEPSEVVDDIRSFIRMKGEFQP